MRDGIDDVRYLQALDRAIAAARSKTEVSAKPSAALAKARKTRRECYESIQGRWFHYLGGLRPGDLERTRRRMADATVQVDIP